MVFEKAGRSAAASRDGLERRRSRGQGCGIRPWRIFLGLLATLSFAATPLEAGLGDFIQLPANPRDVVHGVRLELDTRWVSGNGYRPVRVRMATQPPIPSAQERTFRISLEPIVRGVNSAGVSQPSVSRAVVSRWAAVRVSGRLVLAEGATAGETTLLVPQSASWLGLRVFVEEDGRRLEECSSAEGISLEPAQQEWTEVTPSVLLVTRHAPRWAERTLSRFRVAGREEPTRRIPRLAEIGAFTGPGQPLPSVIPGVTGRTMMQGLPVNVLDDSLSDQQMLAQLSYFDKLEMAAPEDFPSRWIELSCFDLIFIDLEDARRLADRFPARWNALRTWVEAGQTAIVFGLDERFQELDEVERLFGLASVEPVPSLVRAEPGDGSADDSEEDDQTGAAMRPVEGPAVSQSGWDVTAAPYAEGFSAIMKLHGNQAGRFIQSAAPNPTQPEPVPEQSFRRHSAGLGRVVAVARPDPFQPRDQLAWMLNSLETQNWSWMARHGLSLRRDNPDVHLLQIPGVGRPPRVTYLVLITLFALAIGPLNYWALWRCRRLHLLLLTVPLAALSVTILLMGYVVASDGFQVRVQARSLTLLDQRQGRGVSWSTQSYFASLPPSAGLRFSDATVVYPLNAHNHPPNVLTGSRRLSLEMDWTSDQHLRGGYLRPRELQHFLVLTAGSQPARLQFQPDESGWHVTNELGATIRYLLVHAAPGEFYWRDELADGAGALLEKRTSSDARGRILQLFQQFDISSVGVVRPGWSRYLTIDVQAVEPRLATSIMETRLSRLRTEPERALPPRSYVAIVDWPEWLEVGVDAPRREPSLHVVMGHW